MYSWGNGGGAGELGLGDLSLRVTPQLLQGTHISSVSIVSVSCGGDLAGTTGFTLLLGFLFSF